MILKLTSALLFAGFAFAACSPKPVVASDAATPAAAPVSTASTATPASPAATGPIMGIGKIAAVDAKAGTIKLDHQPIPALDWPAMSMAFTVTDPAMLAGLSAGDSVSFEIKSPTETTVLTKVQKQ
ncbi:MAG: hypothetical protein GC155_15885 [Alphaproteobacteria bacterium]|nr:hypothetical protein [Alphaproteobacteria bacterium]